MLMIVVVLTVACICVPNNNADKPIIAFEDIIYKEFRDQYLHKHQQWHEIQQIDRWYSKIAQTKREMSMSADEDGLAGSPLFRNNSASTSSHRPGGHRRRKKRKPGKYYCLLSVNLFKTYLKNDHTVLSVFQRTDGTNFSTKQRIGLFLLYMYCIMMADAIFYGNQEDRRPMGELTASALISLIGTCPVYIIRVLFQWSKPRVVKSAKSRNGSFHETVVNDRSSSGSVDGTMTDKTDFQPVFPVKIKDTIELITPPDNTTISPYSATNSNAAGTTLSVIDNEESNALSDESYEEELKDEEYLKKTGQIHDTNMNKRLSNTYWSAIAELKKTARPDMKLVRKCMHYVNTKANASEKASLASEIRLILFNYNYPFPHWYKKMAWTILTVTCIICVVVSVIYGIQFDIKSAQQQAINDNNDIIDGNLSIVNEQNAQFCNLSRKLDIQKQALTIQQIKEQQEQQRLDEINEEYADDFKEIEYDSTKWLLNVLISFLTSVFIWQPLSIYLLTWLKIWAFHNGLIMEASVYNLGLFLCCCCSQKKKSLSTQKSMLEFQHKKSLDRDDPNGEYDKDGKAKNIKVSYVPEDSQIYELSVSGSGFAAVGNEDRALDVIGFFM